MEEIWKDVQGFEGYYVVSNLGNVRALDRYILKSSGIVQPIAGHAMAQTLNSDGYPTVKLSKDGKSIRIAVHRLVAIAFVPNPEGLAEVNHIDFDRTNASADNLEWVNHKENVYYTIGAGRHICNTDLTGANNPNYRNTTLKDYYAAHPDEKTKLARKGSQNGRAKPVRALFEDGTTKEFGYLRECADYLISNNICKNVSRDVVSYNISKSIKNDKPYCNCHFSRV